MIAPYASRRMTGIFCALLALVVHLRTSGAAFAVGEEPGRPLVFGFLPIVSPEKLVRRFEPLVDHLAETLGVPIALESAPDCAEFLHRTHEEKRYDFLFTAPQFYYLAQRKAGLVTMPLSRADPKVTGEIRIVAETQSTPNVPFSVAPWVGATRAEALAGALVALSATEKGLALFEHLGWPGFIRTGAEEYDVFERFSKVVTG